MYWGGNFLKRYNVGLIGAGFMAKAHAVAYASMPMFFTHTPAVAIRKTIVDRNADTVCATAESLGFEKGVVDWHDIIDDSDIDIIDICTPNDSHCEIAVAAAQAGKHILCEKPMARTPEEARRMCEAVKHAGVKNMLGFNYKRTPAVQLAKELISEGAIGEILDFKGTYLQDWSANPKAPLSWRFQKEKCGAGALGDIATHIIDMLCFLLGQFEQVNAHLSTYIDERPIQHGGKDMLGMIKDEDVTHRGIVDVDDYCFFMIKMKNGAFGHIESSRNAWGRNNFITFEIHGTKGTICFNYERRDELKVCFAEDLERLRGFRTIYTGPQHPYGQELWPIPALGIGYTETKIIDMYEFVKSIAEDEPIHPNFTDGYQIALIADAILRSNKSGYWEEIMQV